MMIKVVVVDDSPTALKIVGRALERDGDIFVVGSASDPSQILPLIDSLEPDVVTLDVVMPQRNGLDVLSEIMENRPRPVIMVSSLTGHGTSVGLEALSRGAAGCIVKPAAKDKLPEFENALRVAVRSAVNQRSRLTGRVQPESKFACTIKARPSLIGIAASTGGVQSIDRILKRLPAGSPPILITQHMREQTLLSLARRINEEVDLDVRLGEEGEKLGFGMVRIAPPSVNLTAENSGSGLVTRLVPPNPADRFVPCADVMFRSMATSVGASAIGIILSGMSEDGARGLLEMRKAGALCVGESEESCVVYGMPKAAAKIGALALELASSEIAAELESVLARHCAILAKEK